MSGREIELRELHNRLVVDSEGERVGRIEELHAEISPDDPAEYVVTEFHLGTYALFEAIAGSTFGRAFARLLWKRGYRRHVIAWDLLDLGDPAHPRLRRPKRELPEMPR